MSRLSSARRPLELIVTDRETIEAEVRVRTRYVVISIRDPGRRKAKVRQQPGLLDVLHLAFDDAEPSSNFELPRSIRLMTPADARAIWNFVDRYRERVGAIVVHCEQGMSRSPAVAIAISRQLDVHNQQLESEFQPNPFVVRLMLAPEALGGALRCRF